MHIRHLTAAAFAVTALTLTACSGTGASTSDKPTDTKKLDQAGRFACDDFAHEFQFADSKSERLDLAHKINKWAPSSKTDRIAYSGGLLANGAAGSDGAWQMAADAFAQSCLDAGWKA
ncbi:hypothetical protein AB8A21_17555 [Streptomyces sp. BF23-18]|uniref:hypothetical protein n=1 Tax=Streptomyces sp. BF23-18 TaxID=3240282 RepID=UPI0034E3FCA8